MMLLLSSSSSSFVNNNHPSLVVVVVVVVVLGTQVRSSSFEAVCPQLQLLGGQRVTCRLPVRLYDALHQPVAAAECRVEGSHINISSGGDITPPLRCEPGWVAQLIVYVMAQWGRRQEPKNGKNRKKKEKLTKDEQNTQHTHTHIRTPTFRARSLTALTPYPCGVSARYSSCSLQLQMLGCYIRKRHQDSGHARNNLLSAHTPPPQPLRRLPSQGGPCPHGPPK